MIDRIIKRFYSSTIAVFILVPAHASVSASVWVFAVQENRSIEESGRDSASGRGTRIEGKVVEVTGKNIKIELISEGKPAIGDFVDLNYKTLGGKELFVGTWRVTNVTGSEIHAIEYKSNITARIGLKAYIYAIGEKPAATEIKATPKTRVDQDIFSPTFNQTIPSNQVEITNAPSFDEFMEDQEKALSTKKSFVESSRQSQDGQSLAVRYADPFSEIEIYGQVLSYFRREPPAGMDNASSPESYVGHSVEIKLNEQQIGAIKEWINGYKIYSLKNPESVGDPNSPLAAYQYSLSVTERNGIHRIEWTGESVWERKEEQNRVKRTVDRLKAICKQMVDEQGDRPVD